jgi:hypothetical protein
MERLQELISQLQEQHERQVDPSQMLLTIRLLEAELTSMSGRATLNRGSAKVAVMMPSSMKMYAGQQAVSEARTVPELRTAPENSNSAEIRDIPGIKNVPEIKAPEIKSIPDPRYAPNAATSGEETRAAREESKTPSDPAIDVATDLKTIVNPDLRNNPVRPVPVGREQEQNGRRSNGLNTSNGLNVSNGLNDPDLLADIPTFAHQQPPRELNDVIGTNGASLNDKLKADVKDLSAALNDTPVRDLKKAIGVNDRYVFISQLFRGDEVMYERSIKTINGFRILPEAEYWMERELKVKLGWDENREATRHFYQLVKRRFS